MSDKVKFCDVMRSARMRNGMMVKELAEKADVSTTTIRNLEKGTNQPNAKTRMAIVRSLGYSTYEEMLAATGHISTPRHRETPADGDSIPVYSTVPAGDGDMEPTDLGHDNGISDGRRIPRWLVGVDDPDAFGLEIVGDSMSPDYRPGDVVICSPEAVKLPGMIAAVRLDDGSCTIKRVEVVDGDDDVWALVPINPMHRTRHVPRDSVVRMSRVVGRWQRT